MGLFAFAIRDYTSNFSLHIRRPAADEMTTELILIIRLVVRCVAEINPQTEIRSENRVRNKNLQLQTLNFKQATYLCGHAHLNGLFG